MAHVNSSSYWLDSLFRRLDRPILPLHVRGRNRFSSILFAGEHVEALGLDIPWRASGAFANSSWPGIAVGFGGVVVYSFAHEEPLPAVAHLLVSDAVEKEYEDSLQRVEDAEQVLERQARTRYGQRTKNPSQAQENEDGDRRPAALVRRGFLLDWEQRTAGAQRMDDLEEDHAVCQDDENHRGKHGCVEWDAVQDTAVGRNEASRHQISPPCTGA